MPEDVKMLRGSSRSTYSVLLLWRVYSQPSSPPMFIIGDPFGQAKVLLMQAAFPVDDLKDPTMLMPKTV